MILGHVRDRFPFVILNLRGQSGPLQVEFVIDTGFDGEMALPPSVLQHLDATLIGDRIILLADKTPRRNSHYMVQVDWDGETRSVEAVMMEGRPLLGNEIIEGSLLQIEITDGDEVSIEPL